MSAKKVIIAGIVLAAAAGGVFIYVNSIDPTQGKTQAQTSAAVANTQVSVVTSDTVVLPINPENTELVFTGSSAAGKQPAFFEKFSGEAAINKDGVLQSLKAEIEMSSVMSGYDTLTKKFKDEPGFFEVAKYPKSSFIATEVKAGGDPAVAGSTHIVTGNLQIRDVTKSIKFPATIVVNADAVSFKTEFTIGRHDFGVNYEGGTLYPDVRENVLINISTKISRTGNGSKSGDVKKADAAPRALEVFTETIPDSLIKFEMRPVQGDDAAKIKPFFIGKTEVTWDEYGVWAFMYDQQSEAKKIQLRSKKLRPSAPYHEADHSFGYKDRPAVGMSLIAAQDYCKWLSEKTGKTYRLPTKAEWLHAYKQGGLEPSSVPENVTDIAWLGDNSEEKHISQHRSNPISSVYTTCLATRLSMS